MIVSRYTYPVQGGPKELAKMVSDARRTPHGIERDEAPPASTPTWDPAYGNIYGEGLEQLLSLVYRVSFRKEEGRYPKFALRVMTLSEKGQRLPYCVRFKPEIGLDVDTLHRLAPTIPPYPMALMVKAAEKKGKWQFKALGIVRDAFDRVHSGGGHLPLFGQGRYVRHIIRVNGPGAISVDEKDHLELREGEVGRVEDFLRSDKSTELLRGMSKGLFELSGTPRRYREGSLEYGELQLDTYFVVQAIWLEVLRLTAELRHGGTFVILPCREAPNGRLSDKAGEVIKLGHKANLPDLGVLVLDAFKLIDADYERLVEWRQDIRDRALGLAHASAADGCVVLDRNLRLIGFKGEILPEGRHRPNGKKSGGMRHRSAQRLSKQVRGAVCFVVSQDGGISVFEKGEREGPFHVLGGESTKTG